MSIPLLGSDNKALAARSFEDALLDLIQGALLHGIPAPLISSGLIQHGISIQAQSVVQAMLQAASKGPAPERNGSPPPP